MKIGIVGSGMAGLTAAVLLSHQGHEVTVYESGDKVGGKLNEKMIGSYRFDLGPSLFTMPHWIDEIYTKVGKDPRHYYDYRQLDVGTHYFYEDGTQFKSHKDPRIFEMQLRKEGIDTQNFQKYLRKISFIYDTTEFIFLKSSLHKWRSYMHTKVLQSLLRLPFIEGLRSMHHMNASYFKDTRLQQYFDRMATYNGSNPYHAPGTLNLISHIEHKCGVFYPEGGMYNIAKGLYKLALDLGVKFVFNATVDEILIDEDKIEGLRIGSKSIDYDAVVSNMDVFYTYKKLMTSQKAPEKTLRQEKSSSGLIFYWGIKRQFTELGLHNIFFAENYKAEFEDIFENKIPHHDPTVYINVSSKESEGDAPEGCENWFVMINVPSDTGQDWESLKAKARQNIIDKLNRMLKTDVSALIEVEEVLDPKLIDLRTFSHQGALYGNASNKAMSAFFRHANFSSKIKNLYFCGGSVHPGGGIPLAVQSGKIVAGLFVKN